MYNIKVLTLNHKEEYNMNNRVKVYTDGACSNNQLKENRGGYGAIILGLDEGPIRIKGGYRNTTNNRMELRAVIEGLKRVDEDLLVTVYSDSQYVVDGITKWMPGWLAKGKKRENWTLWMELYNIVMTFSNIEFIKVKGHSNNMYNNEADKLAREACEGFNLQIDQDQDIPDNCFYTKKDSLS